MTLENYPIGNRRTSPRQCRHLCLWFDSLMIAPRNLGDPTLRDT